MQNLTPRARLCAFIGYPTGIKGYKLFVLHTKQIFVSCDVVFHETTFPFHSAMPITQLQDPVPNLVLPSPFLTIPPNPTIPPSDLHHTILDHTVPDHTVHEPLPTTSDPAPSPNPFVLSHNEPDHVPLRRSTHSIKPPSYLQDFHCHLLHIHSQPASAYL